MSKKSVSKRSSKSSVTQNTSNTSVSEVEEFGSVSDVNLNYSPNDAPNNNFKIKKVTTTNKKGKQVSYPLLVPNYQFNDVITQSVTKNKKIRNPTSKTYQEYYEKGLYPFAQSWNNRSIRLVPLEHFNNIKEVKYAVEKPAFIDKSDSDSQSEKVGKFSGNQINTRAYNFRFYANFTQIRGRDGKKVNELTWTPTVFKTDQIRADDDDIGHLIAFTNNMYALNDPYAETLYIKQGDKYVKKSPDPIKVNRAFVKSVFDSLGFEQGKVIVNEYNKYLKEIGAFQQKESNTGVFSYRDAKGDSKTFTISEQNMAIAEFVAPTGADIFADTPSGEIRFSVSEEVLEKVKLQTQSKAKPKGKIEFIINEDTKKVVKETKETKYISSDDLLKSAVRKYNMKATTAQATAESLYRQGYITYPRVNAETGEIEDQGIRLKVPLSEFKGSQEERKILTIIEEANKALEQGLPYLLTGNWKLTVNNKELALSNQADVFFDEERSFTDAQFDLVVKEQGKTNEELVSELILKDIGTKATRTPSIEEMLQAGIITTEFDGNKEVFRLDTRGIFMASAYGYVKNHPENSAIILGSEVKKAQNLEEILNIWNKYEPIDEKAFSKHITTKSDEYIESQTEMALIDAL